MASREPGGHAVTPPPGGRDFHPHQISVVKVLDLAPHPPVALVSRERVARRDTCKKVQNDLQSYTQ